MLQRAASNAYSWWWASHIRTKQSKWLEQCLQDMEEKVQAVIKLIEEDGDSFAKRAEMYYKKRPELINFVEESFRAFRALADRYDLLSKDLQNANNTIATCLPDQVQFAMEDYDDCITPKIPKNFQMPPPGNMPNIPKVPKAPIKDLRGLIKSASRQLKDKKSSLRTEKTKNAVKSGLSKSEAVEEIDKLQKEILALQTVKEFVKSSYQSGLAKYWGIENQIMEMQQRVCKLQDEFNVAAVIEDEEARTLMAKAALTSCEDTLTQLQEKQERSAREAKEESKKIEDARERLKSLKIDVSHEQGSDDRKGNEYNNQVANSGDELQNMDKEVVELTQGGKDIAALQQKLREHLETGAMASITVTELAEKIDELVTKVISLETSVSSQTVLINRLRSETDGLHSQIRSLEEEKESLVDGTHVLSSRVRELGGKLERIQDLNKNVERQNSNLETNFAEARSSLDNLTERLSTVRPDDELESPGPQQGKPDVELKLPEKIKGKKDVPKPGNGDKSTTQLGNDDKNTPQPGNDEMITPQPGNDDKSTPQPGNDDNKSTSQPENYDKCTPEPGDGEKNTPQTETGEKNMPQPGHGEKNANTSNTEQNRNEEDTKEQVLEASDKERHEERKRVGSKSVIFLDPKPKEHVEKENPTKIGEDAIDVESLGDMDKGEMNWQQMLLSGLEDREKILLSEYTTVLRSYKDLKKRLSEMEKKEKESDFEMTLHIRDLKSAITKRDEEIQHLRQKLNLLQERLGENENAKGDSLPLSDPSDGKGSQPEAESCNRELTIDTHICPTKQEEDESLELINTPPVMSAVEEKLRLDIDAILDENLDFWLRFSTAFHQIQKFKTEAQDLQNEIAQLKEKSKQEGNATTDLKSEIRPLYKHLTEIQTELTMWLDQSVSLKDELKRRFASLCSIQEEITLALKEGVEEEEIRFSSHQAAKFQGEVLNMKQENNKVREELQAGHDHVSILQLDIEKTLRKLNEEFGFSGNPSALRHSSSKTRVPLRSFIFGTKPKKQKHSIFSCMHPNKRYQVLRAGIPL